MVAVGTHRERTAWFIISTIHPISADIHRALFGAKKPLLVVALLLSVAAIGRAIGLIIDGRSKGVVVPIVVQIVFVSILMFSYSVLA